MSSTESHAKDKMKRHAENCMGCLFGIAVFVAPFVLAYCAEQKNGFRYPSREEMDDAFDDLPPRGPW
jgi:hypothetical protein